MCCLILIFLLLDVYFKIELMKLDVSTCSNMYNTWSMFCISYTVIMCSGLPNITQLHPSNPLAE